MRQHKPLPIKIQRVFRNARVKYQSRSLGLRLDEKLHLRIMSQWFKMPDADAFSRRLFFVEYFPRAKSSIDRKTVADQPLYQLGLHLTHKSYFYL
jgi:hypothetical protein